MTNIQQVGKWTEVIDGMIMIILPEWVAWIMVFAMIFTVVLTVIESCLRMYKFYLER